jgi:anti-sigma B factor antagonist
MEIREQKYGAVTSLRPLGPVITDDAAALRNRLLDTHRQSLGRLVLDMGGVPYLDSAGLEALLDVTEALGRSGQALKLCGANDVIRESLELTEIADLFDYFGDVNDAVRSFV